jgi:hypothetical protein
MRVTIIADENRINVEGFSHDVDCSSLEGVHVVQWYGDHGELEYWNGLGSKTLRTNTHFEDFEPFQFLLDAWEIEAKKNVA